MTTIRKRFVKPEGIFESAHILPEAILDAVTVTPVGATNPYALARVIAEQQTGEIIVWENIPTIEKVQEKLTTYLKTPYENLFDPAKSQVLFLGLLPAKIAMLGPSHQHDGRPDLNRVINPVMEKVISEALKMEGVDMTNAAAVAMYTDKITSKIQKAQMAAIRSIGKSMGSVPLGQRPMSYEISGTGVGKQSSGCTESNVIWKTLPKYYTNYPNVATHDLAAVVDDFLQGSLPDCFLLAAMSAWFWYNWPLPKGPRNMTPDITVPLYNPDGSSSARLVPGELPLPTANSERPVYAGITPQNEVYPAIWEKAYADLLGCGPSPVQSAGGRTNPDVAKLTGGDPLYALAAVSGYKYSWIGTSPTAYYTTGLNTAAFSAAFDANGKAKYPMVAWTYYTGGDTNPPPDRIHAPPGVRYVTDWMVANHAYTVLGRKKIGVDYIILRNPYGPTYGGIPDMTNYPLTPDTAGIYKNAYPWKPTSGTYTLNIGQVKSGTRAKPDGIFALKLDLFKTYFEAVGWVVPR